MYDSFCDWKINNQFEDDLVERIQIAGLRFDVQRKYRVVDVCLGLPQLLLGGMIYASFLQHVLWWLGFHQTARANLIGPSERRC